MHKRVPSVLKLSAVLAALFLLVLRGYREFVPAGAKATAYVFASVEGGEISSPHGSEYVIQFNDAGAMHSGHHWTWVVGYRWLTGLYVKTEGYLGAEYAVDGEPIPIEWDGNDPVLPFENGRYD